MTFLGWVAFGIVLVATISTISNDNLSGGVRILSALCNASVLVYIILTLL